MVGFTVQESCVKNGRAVRSAYPDRFYLEVHVSNYYASMQQSRIELQPLINQVFNASQSASYELGHYYLFSWVNEVGALPGFDSES